LSTFEKYSYFVCHYYDCVEFRLCHNKNLDGTQNLPTCKFQVQTFFWEKFQPILGIHEVESNRQKEIRNYLTQILEPTPTTVEMDVEIEIFLVTYGPNVGIPESISLKPVATPTITK